MSALLPSAKAMASAEIWDPGEYLWQEGDEVKPLRIQQGVVVYRRGEASIGMLGPGHVLLPLPGIKKGGKAATAAVAITETAATPIEDVAREVSDEELETSVRAVLDGADRLGNLSIPQRLAALLLEVSELQGHPVIHCRQDILAIAVGSRRETVAVVLSQWRDYDWIQTRYRRVKVVHREALHQIAIGGTPPPGVVSF